MSDWGWPTCWICGKEFDPLTGDGDGACTKCYYGYKDEDEEEKKEPDKEKLEAMASKVKILWNEWNVPD